MGLLMEATRATILWCLLLCVLVVEISGAKRGTSKVVYGSDDRKDYFEVSSSDKELGTGVALLLTGSNIFSQSGSTYTPRGTADAEEWWDLSASPTNLSLKRMSTARDSSFLAILLGLQLRLIAQIVCPTSCSTTMSSKMVLVFLSMKTKSIR